MQSKTKNYMALNPNYNLFEKVKRLQINLISPKNRFGD